MTEVTTAIASISALIVALAALVGVVVNAFHAVAAKVEAARAAAKADAAAAGHVANTSAIAAVAQNVQQIALAMPSALQSIAPQLQAVAAQPIVAKLMPDAGPTLINVHDLAQATADLVEEIHQAVVKPTPSEVTVNVASATDAPIK